MRSPIKSQISIELNVLGSGSDIARGPSRDVAISQAALGAVRDRTSSSCALVDSNVNLVNCIMLTVAICMHTLFMSMDIGREEDYQVLLAVALVEVVYNITDAFAVGVFYRTCRIR